MNPNQTEFEKAIEDLYLYCGAMFTGKAYNNAVMVISAAKRCHKVDEKLTAANDLIHKQVARIKDLEAKLNDWSNKELLGETERCQFEAMKVKLAAVENAPCPWPEHIWPMTESEYVKAIPNESLRTAMSGFLMRKGWETYREAVKRLND